MRLLERELGVELMRRTTHTLELSVAFRTICHTDGIRTTLDIDEDLMTSLLARLPGRSKTAAIEHAIEVFLANDAVEQLKQLAGRMDIDDRSSELRALDRTT